MRHERSRLGFLTFIAACALALAFATVTSAVQPLRVSGNGRHLIKADGTPFFWTGDTAWRLFKLSREDIDHYLDDRAARGFNVIQGPVLLTGDASIESRNFYGDSNTNPDSHPAGWFNHIDYIVNAAEQRGLYIALVAAWGDIIDQFGSSQAQKEARANDFGNWLGNRYRYNDNVIWIVAGEYNILGTSNDIRNVWNALGNGLKNGSGGNHLITIHASYQDGRQSSSSMFHNSGWLSFNMIQSSQSGDFGPGADNFNLVYDDYNLTPVKPVIDGEAHYEGLTGWNAFGVRRRAYWSVFAGGMGHTYGTIPVALTYRGGNDDASYGDTTLWSDALSRPGASDMRLLRRLIESRPMLKRIPDQNMLTTWAGNVPDRMIAQRDAQKRWAMVYVPKKNKTFTVNLVTSMAGSQIKAWWYDPRNGKVRNAGAFARLSNGGFRSFTTPSSGQDWVLVLDDASRGYAKPGTGGPMP